MLKITSVPINLAAVEFVCSQGTASASEIFAVLRPKDVKNPSPSLKKFLGNAESVRRYLVTQFFREGWTRLCNEGKFGNVWDEEYAAERQRKVESKFVKTWPSVTHDELREMLDNIAKRRDPHARALWQRLGRARPGSHPRHTPRCVPTEEPEPTAV
jgi:hypothetical protein